MYYSKKTEEQTTPVSKVKIATSFNPINLGKQKYRIVGLHKTHYYPYESIFTLLRTDKGETKGVIGDLVFEFKSLHNPRSVLPEAQQLILWLEKNKYVSLDDLYCTYCDNGTINISIPEELLHRPGEFGLYLPEIYTSLLSKIAGDSLSSLNYNRYAHGIYSLTDSSHTIPFHPILVKDLLSCETLPNTPPSYPTNQKAGTSNTSLLINQYLDEVSKLYRECLANRPPPNLARLFKEDLGPIYRTLSRCSCLLKIISNTSLIVRDYDFYIRFFHAFGDLAEQLGYMLFERPNIDSFRYTLVDYAAITKRHPFEQCKQLIENKYCNVKPLCGVRSPLELSFHSAVSSKAQASPHFYPAPPQQYNLFIPQNVSSGIVKQALHPNQLAFTALLLSGISMVSHQKLFFQDSEKGIPLTAYFCIIPPTGILRATEFPVNYADGVREWRYCCEEIEAMARNLCSYNPPQPVAPINALKAERQKIYRHLKISNLQQTEFEELKHKQRINRAALKNTIAKSKNKHLLQIGRPAKSDEGHFLFDPPDDGAPIVQFLLGTSTRKKQYIKQLQRAFHTPGVPCTFSGCALHTTNADEALKLRQSKPLKPFSSCSLFIQCESVFQQKSFALPAGYQELLTSIVEGQNVLFSLSQMLQQQVDNWLAIWSSTLPQTTTNILRLQLYKLMTLLHILKTIGTTNTTICDPDVFELAIAIIDHSNSVKTFSLKKMKKDCARAIHSWLMKRGSPYVYSRDIRRQFERCYSIDEISLGISALENSEFLARAFPKYKRLHGAPTSQLYEISALKSKLYPQPPLVKIPLQPDWLVLNSSATILSPNAFNDHPNYGVIPVKNLGKCARGRTARVRILYTTKPHCLIAKVPLLLARSRNSGVFTNKPLWVPIHVGLGTSRIPQQLPLLPQRIMIIVASHSFRQWKWKELQCKLFLKKQLAKRTESPVVASGTVPPSEQNPLLNQFGLQSAEPTINIHFNDILPYPVGFQETFSNQDLRAAQFVAKPETPPTGIGLDNFFSPSVSLPETFSIQDLRQTDSWLSQKTHLRLRYGPLVPTGILGTLLSFAQPITQCVHDHLVFFLGNPPKK